jgi:hypothetical protein
MPGFHPSAVLDVDVLWELVDDLEGEIEGGLHATWAEEHFH